MKTIEVETVIPDDGRLPASFRKVFGRKALIIVVYEEEEQEQNGSALVDDAARLMQLAGKISAFRDIADPVAYQQQLRNEWTRGLE